VVDTAAAAGRVRVQSTGELCVVEDKPGREIEAAVLDAIGSGGWRQIEMVRWRAARKGEGTHEKALCDPA